MGKLSQPKFKTLTADYLRNATQKHLKEAQALLSQIDGYEAGSWRKILQDLRQIDHLFSQSWSLLIYLLGVNNSDEMRQAQEELQPEIISFYQKLGQNKNIFNQLDAVGPQLNNEPAAVQKIVSDYVKHAKLSGVSLPTAEQEKLNKLRLELSQITTTFQNNVLDDTKSYEKIITDKNELRGCSTNDFALYSNYYTARTKKESTPESGPWAVTLDFPSFLPIMSNCENRELREEIYKRQIIKASFGKFDNRENINKVLSLRGQISKILGFNNYGELSLATKMADSPQEIFEFIDKLAHKSLGRSKEEIAELQKFAEDELGFKDAMQNWDRRFIVEKYRKQKLDIDNDELKKYFPLDHVVDQMLALNSRLFNIEFKRVPSETWDKDVQYFEVSRDGKAFAGFYLDPYSRPKNKRGGAWMSEITNRYYVDGYDELPIAGLSCNFSPPVGKTPSLLNFSEVLTLFHEFGHGSQHMLTNVDYPEVAGINGVEWDAVELASQFMENFCYEKEFLGTLGKHYETGAAIPDATIKKLQEERKFLAGFQMMRQLSFALTDMRLHTESGQEPMAVFHEVNSKFSPMPIDKEDQFLCGFGHIFAGGYAAGYYSYKWAEVLSCDVYEKFRLASSDAELKQVGAKYAETILGKGGSFPAVNIFKEFMGRAPSSDALLKSMGLE